MRSIRKGNPMEGERDEPVPENKGDIVSAAQVEAQRSSVDALLAKAAAVGEQNVEPTSEPQSMQAEALAETLERSFETTHTIEPTRPEPASSMSQYVPLTHVSMMRIGHPYFLRNALRFIGVFLVGLAMVAAFAAFGISIAYVLALLGL